MLITDSPELMNLQEDQAPSTESLIAPSQPQNTQYYAMGQICVAEGYRGMGIFDGLYAKHKENLSARFELCVTEIAKRNTRSLAAHKRVGFEIIHEYYDTIYPELWEVVAWDFA